jgi:hypothetical protein
MPERPYLIEIICPIKIKVLDELQTKLFVCRGTHGTCAPAGVLSLQKPQITHTFASMFYLQFLFT